MANEELGAALLDARPISVDLFSGVGGLSLGLEAAGFYSAAHVEVEAQASRYASYNFPLAQHFGGSEAGDVRNFDWRNVRQVVGSREVAVIAGGPPCQGFSTVGRRRIDDPLNDLVLEMARLILEVEPQSFIIENVPGSLSSQYWQFDKALEMLSSKYSVSKPTVLRAEDFGVPQKRRRVFTVGFRDDLHVQPSLPVASHGVAGAQLSFLTSPTPTVGDALLDVPNCDDFEHLFNEDTAPYVSPPHSEYAAAMRDERGLASERGYQVDWDPGLCTNLRRTKHGPALAARLEVLSQGQMDKSSRIPRLALDGLSVTIRAGTTSERGSWSAPRPCHPVYPRVLSTRECARLQSFPDWFRFHPVKWHGNRQVGNAVPPLLAKAVGEHVRGLLSLSSASTEGAVARRDPSLIAADLEEAAAANYQSRTSSHQVVNTGASFRGARPL